MSLWEIFVTAVSAAVQGTKTTDMAGEEKVNETLRRWSLIASDHRDCDWAYIVRTYAERRSDVSSGNR